MYVDEDYLSYRYVVSYSDNFVVLSNSSSVNASWDSPRTIDTVIQYIKPSSLSIPSEQTFTSSRTFSRIDVNSDLESRADYPEIMTATFCIGFFVVFLINGLTKLVKKGGIFFGS